MGAERTSRPPGRFSRPETRYDGADLRRNNLPEKSSFALRKNVLRSAKGDTHFRVVLALLLALVSLLLFLVEVARGHNRKPFGIDVLAQRGIDGLGRQAR